MIVKMKNNSESPEEAELRSWKRKLIGAWALTIPLALFMYSAKFGLFMIDDKIMTLFLLILAFRFTADESISIFSMACLFISGCLHLVDFYLRHRAAKTKQ